MPAGPNSPSAVTDDAGVGTLAWASPGNAVSSNNQRATSDYFHDGSPSAVTHYLKAVAFGFSIPAEAVIDGVVVEVERAANFNSMNSWVTDNRVRLIKADAIQGTDKADVVTHWPIIDTVKSYGGAADLWDDDWSPSDFNDSGFGVALAAELFAASGSSVSARVDHVRITIHYTGGGGITRRVSRRGASLLSRTSIGKSLLS